MNTPSKTPTLDRQFLRGSAFAILLVATPLTFAFYLSRSVNEESGQRALAAHLRTKLEDHRQLNGSYPSSLSDLNISSFPAESHPRMLPQFNYYSNGATYTLSCVGASTGKAIVVTPVKP